MLNAENLSFRYTRRTPWVVDGLSLHVEPGEVVGLCGPSGSGKSTLARLLAGHLRPQRGSVSLDGCPIEVPRGRAHPVQLVMQDAQAAMDPRWKVAEVLASAGAGSEDLAELTPALVEERWLDRFPHELSGGELQRVNLARALLADPRHLVADEISASLDALTQARIWHLLGELTTARGIGVLAISHDRALLDQVCGRVLEWTGRELRLSERRDARRSVGAASAVPGRP